MLYQEHGVYMLLFVYFTRVRLPVFCIFIIVLSFILHYLHARVTRNYNVYNTYNIYVAILDTDFGSNYIFKPVKYNHL